MTLTWRKWFVFCLGTMVAAVASAEPKNDASKESFTPLVFVQKGEIPLVITSPHGGREAIPGVPKRVGGDQLYRFVAAGDENTGELTDVLASELERLLGRKPYVIRAKFARKYCDVNREPKDAYESPGAKLQYDYYHKAIADACHEVLENWHAGLLLDIHGQSTYPDKLIRGTNNGRTVTMLAERRGAEAYMGQSSLLGRMAQRGYEVLPPIDTTEKEPERYGGGHTVKTYGSHQSGGIDAIQFEFGRQYRVPMSEAEKSARDLAEAIVEYAHDYLPAALPETEPAGR